jgi:hypothetical protein
MAQEGDAPLDGKRSEGFPVRARTGQIEGEHAVPILQALAQAAEPCAAPAYPMQAQDGRPFSIRFYDQGVRLRIARALRKLASRIISGFGTMGNGHFGPFVGIGCKNTRTGKSLEEYDPRCPSAGKSGAASGIPLQMSKIPKYLANLSAFSSWNADY